MIYVIRVVGGSKDDGVLASEPGMEGSEFGDVDPEAAGQSPDVWSVHFLYYECNGINKLPDIMTANLFRGWDRIFQDNAHFLWSP